MYQFNSGADYVSEIATILAYEATKGAFTIQEIGEVSNRTALFLAEPHVDWFGRERARSMLPMR